MPHRRRPVRWASAVVVVLPLLVTATTLSAGAGPAGSAALSGRDGRADSSIDGRRVELQGLKWGHRTGPRAGATASPSPTSAPTASPTASPAASPSPSPDPALATAAFGVTLPSVVWDPTILDSFSATVGRSPGIVMWYAGWAHDTDFYAAGADAIVARGATPELTWEPYDYLNSSTDQPDYSLGRIISGAYDPYVQRWATEIKAWGKPLRLRFAAEMNGNWFPWSEQVNGNQPGQYVAAWRHVHDIFAEYGVDNVTWVWSPNVAYSGSTSFAELYPGDAYVDAVGLDGYNWGPTYGHVWQSFSDIFDASFGAVRALTSRPLYISEVASTETGGSKSSWITDMFAQLKLRPYVRGFTWFDYDKENDWRVESSATSIAAFSAGVADPRFG